MTQIPEGEYRSPPASSSSIVFGTGSMQRLKEKIEQLGASRALVVTGSTIASRTDLVDRVRNILGDKYAGVFSGVVQHVPKTCVLEGARMAREKGADALVSIGGSSAADAAKGINLVLAESEQIDDFFTRFDLFKGTSAGNPFKRPKLPHIAIPTTLSGAEFTSVAGITDVNIKRKGSFRDAKLIPKVIILDPEVTIFTGKDLWASTGMKILADCFEAICSPKHQPFTDALALHAIQIINRHLARSTVKPLDLSSRAMLQHAVWMVMYGAQSAGLGIVAALRHQIGGGYNVPHGVASTVVLPHSINFNRPIIDERLCLLATSLAIPAGETGSTAAAVVKRVEQLISEVQLPARLRDTGILKENLKSIAEASLHDFSIKFNPRPVTSVEQVLSILEKAW